MEEILASIRRIISEDDAPAAEPAEAAHEEPAESFEPAPEPEPEPAHDDVLELTDRVSLAESVGDIDAYEQPEPAPAPAPAPIAARKVEERLVSEPSATAAASAFDSLTAAIALPPVGRTLEDLAGELLRPLLKAWLDANLPRIVEATVAEEVERIARSRVR
jgi:cell pole-organizing protein PopZ